jgi:predicted dehydrogenase
VNALVVGYGHMGGIHAEHLANLGYRVTTVDPRPEMGADYRKLPAWPQARDFDVAAVAVPIKHLAEVACEVASRVPPGRMLIEKPGAATSAELHELRDKIGMSGPLVGYTERFNPRVQELLELPWAERNQTRAVFVRWNPKPSPDVWTDLLSHDVDLARWLEFGDAAYDTRAGAPGYVRRIMLNYNGGSRVVDLMSHGRKPVYAQWHALVMGGARPFGMCTLRDAAQVLREVERLRAEHEGWAA